jgi:hypothetical protein
VDLRQGRLVHKRVKTHGQSNMPTVEYKLWPETLDLLRRFRSGHPDLFLVSKAGTPQGKPHQSPPELLAGS